LLSRSRTSFQCGAEFGKLALVMRYASGVDPFELLRFPQTFNRLVLRKLATGQHSLLVGFRSGYPPSELFQLCPELFRKPLDLQLTIHTGFALQAPNLLIPRL
jgi:hypothetical protein